MARDSSSWGQRLLGAWSLAVYALLLSPAALIVLFSFNAPQGRFNLIWHRFTLANWQRPLADGAMAQAFATSLLLALAAAALATLLALPLALVLQRQRPRGSRALELLTGLPLGIPEVVLGAGLLLLFVRLNLARGWLSLLMAHTLLCLSYAALALKARLHGHNWTLEDAALDLGASPRRVFLRITLPALMPGLLAALLLSVSLSLDDVLLSNFSAGSVVTFPLWVAGAFQREISPQIHVLSTLVLLLSLSALTLGTVIPVLRQRADRRRRAPEFRTPLSSALRTPPPRPAAPPPPPSAPPAA